MESLEIRPLLAGEEDELGALLGELPARVPLDFVPRTPDEWAWLRRSPGGHRAWIARGGGRMLAHYATLPQRVVVDGEERRFARVVHALQGPAGAGAYLATARRLLDETCGPDKDLLSFAWQCGPADEWRRAAEELRYEVVRTQTLLALDVDPSAHEPSGVHGVEPLLPRGGEVRGLYDACRGAWGASFVRDEAWLRWRFLEHPRAGQRLLAARPDGTLRGCAAYRTLDRPAPRSGWILDWLVPDGEDATARRLLAGLLAQARFEGARTLLASFPEWSPWFRRFQDWGFLVQGSDLRLWSRRTFPRHETYWLRDHWWYQPADLWL